MSGELRDVSASLAAFGKNCTRKESVLPAGALKMHDMSRRISAGRGGLEKRWA